MMEVFQLSLNDILARIQGGSACSQLQIPLKLAWEIIIHKAQGVTLDKVVIDIGKEFSAGLTFVACSRVRRLSDKTFNPPFAYRVASLAKSMRLTGHKVEDGRLCSKERTSFPSFACHP